MYYSELIRVVNTQTNDIKYYVIKCDVRCKITRVEYNRRYDSADGIGNLHQRSRIYKGVEYIHFFTTVTYDNPNLTNLTKFKDHTLLPRSIRGNKTLKRACGRVAHQQAETRYNKRNRDVIDYRIEISAKRNEGVTC